MSHFAKQPSRTQPRHPDVGMLALVPDFWGPCWQARHHVLSRLAGYFHVLWMEPPLELRALLRGQSPRWRRPHYEPARGLETYRPPWWLPSLGKPQWMGDLTFRARLHSARRRLLARGCKRIVLYVWRPEFAGALALAAYDLSCYHIDDE